ncbi:hypothetical protein ACOMHN_028917 [Nucella lapillus]
MGNQAIKPYIVEDEDSDLDDGEICYDTAPETDLHSRDSDDLDDDLNPSVKDAKKVGSSKVKGEKRGKKMSVDAEVVSSLVANVEELLGHLSNHDYQAAHSAAMMLQSCGIGGGGGSGIPPPHTSQSSSSQDSKSSPTPCKGLSEEEQRTLAILEREILMTDDPKDDSQTSEQRIRVSERDPRKRLNLRVAQDSRQASRSPARSGIPTLHRSTSGGRRAPSPGRSRLPQLSESRSANGSGLEGDSGSEKSGTKEGEGKRREGGSRGRQKVRWGEAGSVAFYLPVCDGSHAENAATLTTLMERKVLDLRRCHADNAATLTTLMERKVLDLRRWMSMIRPQYKTACGVASVVSCWNYLFSTAGNGTHSPITQEEALSILGYQEPFGKIRFGPLTSNTVLLKWFQQLNDHFQVSGRGCYLYKPQGKNPTTVTSEVAVHRLKEGLRDCHTAFVYHCHNHYFCPVGYEDVPLKTHQAYSGALPREEVETWILIGDSSHCHPSIHCKRWDDISIDLNCQNPEYLDIRRDWKGLQRHHNNKEGGNLHCILAFQSAAPLTKHKSSQVPRHSGLPVRRSGGASGSVSPEIKAEGEEGKSWGVWLGEEVPLEEELCGSDEDLESSVSEDIQ